MKHIEDDSGVFEEGATPWMNHNLNGNWRTIEEDQPVYGYTTDTVHTPQKEIAVDVLSDEPLFLRTLWSSDSQNPCQMRFMTDAANFSNEVHENAILNGCIALPLGAANPNPSPSFAD